MGIKVTLSYPMGGDMYLAYSGADDWRMGDDRTLLITKEVLVPDRYYTNTEPVAQFNADAWSLVEEYETEPVVGEDTNNELEPPL